MRSRPLALRVWTAQTNAHRRAFATTVRCRDVTERDSKGNIDVGKLLSQPTWSVASLLPAKDQQPGGPEISSKQLHHLLRLSALPAPKDAAEEAAMLSTLSSQLHFVKDIQQVDTTGVEPLRSLRDETAEGEQEAELGMEAMKEALGMETVRGRYHQRIRRRRRGDGVDGESEEGEKWDPLGTAGKKVGRFFVVEGGKDG
ncbi:hypothetical protein LTR36_010743 [Oleoguttula mirabilis]|uniref:Glutamyl-tRNA amidotransferase complex subunit Gta3 domain-containing protein n=1 Tax=Oleoguttula mirabilis TaxID=1507867 RepID=A0AAV9JR91_9PEZI|nr:hypothetical protein LTR36_010743 [Oleoguttula mirabilis]